MDRRHPLAQLAELLHRADPWLRWSEAAAYLGEVPAAKYWLRRGLVPHQRRRVGPGSAGMAGTIMVRARDLTAIAEAIGSVRQHLRQRRAA